MKFTKMHGTGNDYIYVNCFKEQIDNPHELAKIWSERHTGIGSDGLVLIQPSTVADYKMRMFNADGSESEMCGNASRCIGKYVYDKGMTTKTKLTLETLAGIRVLKLIPGKDGTIEKVTVDMGEPELTASRIPVLSSEEQLISYPLNFGHRTKYNVTAVSMGNPHAVIITEHIEQLDLPVIGPRIETSSHFPNRTNTEFIEVVSPDRIQMRVWERGSGETMACGTGACASVVAGVLNGKTARKVTVELKGGELQIEWNAIDNHVYLTGPATFVFEGTLL